MKIYIPKKSGDYEFIFDLDSIEAISYSSQTSDEVNVFFKNGQNLVFEMTKTQFNILKDKIEEIESKLTEEKPNTL